jgi:hypothetical protein
MSREKARRTGETRPVKQSATGGGVPTLQRCPSPDASLRNGARALELAQRASKLSGGNHPVVQHALAAAYAESGRFAEADETAERALSLALAQGNNALADVLRSERSLYQAGKPSRVNRPVAP